MGVGCGSRWGSRFRAQTAFAPDDIIAQTTTVSLFAGIASQATGGSFRDGALAAAFERLFDFY